MRKRLILTTFLLLFSQAVPAQEKSPSTIVAESQAPLVIVGRVESLLRAYSRPREDGKPDTSVDFSRVVFRVQKVLKGKYTEKYIEVAFPDHLGLDKNSQWILFLINSPRPLVGERKMGRCDEAPCYYSSSDWMLQSSRKQIRIVERFLSVSEIEGVKERGTLDAAPNNGMHPTANSAAFIRKTIL